MGCDIHIVIQRETENGWQNLFPDDSPEQIGWRNYNLFGILADVRNGHGFAGIKTGEGWPSIAPHRGLPDDFTVEDNTDVGDHSQTFIYLHELKAFDWDGVTTTLYGIVPAEVYEQLKDTNERPGSYSAGISGPGIVTYEPLDYEFAKIENTLSERPYVRMSWTNSAREATYDWAGKIIPFLEQLANGKALRLVIGFDS